MADSTLNYDLDRWNLDGLDLRLDASGERLLFALDPTLGLMEPAFHIGMGRLAVPRPEAQLLEIIDFKSQQVTKVYRGHKMLGRLPYAGNGLAFYALDPEIPAILSLVIEGIECRVTRTLGIPKSVGVLPTTSFSLKRSETEAFVTVGGEIIRLELGSGQVSHLPICPDRSSKSSVVLKPGARLHLDEVAGTLLIADPQSNKVFELDLQDKTCSSLWSVEGLDQPRTDTAPGSLSGPRSVVPYHAHAHITYDFLTPSARKLLNVSHSLPRGILVADTGNCCVRKRADFPKTPLLFGLSGSTVFTTLLGSGRRAFDISQEVQTAPKDDLRAWSIGTPIGLSVGNAGDLAVTLSDSCSVLVLQPASLILARDDYERTEKHELGST
jgi:hypothetical protein